MSGILFIVIALILGAAIFCGGLYYLGKEREDREARKIYSITAAAGAVIVIGVVIKAAMFGI